MPKTSATGFKALVLLAFLVAVFGGIWFGLFSCGGYAWHKHLMHWTLAVLVLALLLWPRSRSAALGRKALLSLGLVAAFLLAQAFAAPFYPAFSGFGEYLPRVWLALTTGPC